MSYEFNPESQTLELDNPYRVENAALLVSSLFLVICGFAALFIVRARLSQHIDGLSAGAIVLAVVLLMLGIGLGAAALRQLKFYFGRNRPESLAPTLQSDQSGNSPQAGFYKEMLRQSALTFEEPRGAINNVLYTALPQLIFAPRVIQRIAQQQFQTLLALATIFLFFVISLVLAGTPTATGWVGIVYAAISYYFISPLRRSTSSVSQISQGGEIGNGTLVIFATLSIVGTVFLTMFSKNLPDLGGFAINGVLCLSLLATMVALLIFGLALKNQLQGAPQEVGVGRVVESMTMNAHPNKVIEELDRKLIAEWFSRIPNRKYTRTEPQVSGKQGQFGAEIFEETQPQPKSNNTAQGSMHAFEEPYFRWLAVLSWYSTFSFFAGGISALLAMHSMLDGQAYGSTLTGALALIAIGMFSRGCAHLLWGRFDFSSTLIWVELNGSYESASMQIGNQITGNVQTSKSVINIESMTIKVWVSEIESVIFGKDSWRQVIRMRGLQAKADEMAATLKSFGEAKSMIVAPTTTADLHRAQAIGHIGAALSTPSAGQANPLLMAQAAAQKIAQSVSQCKSCNSEIEHGSRFCGDCGAPVVL